MGTFRDVILWGLTRRNVFMSLPISRKLYRAAGILGYMGKVTLTAGVVSHALAMAQQFELVAEQSVQADRAPGVELAGADPHFGAEAEAETVAEAGGAVPENAGRIHQGHKGFGGGFRGGQDHIGMAGAIGIDMGNCGIEIRYNLNG